MKTGLRYGALNALHENRDGPSRTSAQNSEFPTLGQSGLQQSPHYQASDPTGSLFNGPQQFLDLDRLGQIGAYAEKTGFLPRLIVVST
jgi:hypothetical protein